MKCHKCGESNWECECWLASKTGDRPKAEASSRPLDDMVMRGMPKTGEWCASCGASENVEYHEQTTLFICPACDPFETLEAIADHVSNPNA